MKLKSISGEVLSIVINMNDKLNVPNFYFCAQGCHCYQEEIIENTLLTR